MEKAMKISDIIAKLEEIKKTHGDIHVCHAELGMVIGVTHITVEGDSEKYVLLYGGE